MPFWQIGGYIARLVGICSLAGFLLLLQRKFWYMLKLVKEHKRKKILQSLQKQQYPVILNLKDVHTVGVLFAADSQRALDEAQEIVAELKKLKVGFCGAVVEAGKCFKNAAAREEYIEFCNGNNIDFISRDSVNWLGKPGDAAAPQLEGKHFNLFIALNNCNCFTVDYLTQLVEADCIAGMHNSKRMPYTLVMEPASGDFSYSSYLKGLFDFLKTVNA